MGGRGVKSLKNASKWDFLSPFLESDSCCVIVALAGLSAMVVAAHWTYY